MPVRSLNSSVQKWPDRENVDRAVRRWAERVAANRRDVRRIGYFGSYARGDWGVGSDLDLIVIVEDSDRPFERRSTEFDATSLPVPADVLVYTKQEWKSLTAERGFHRTAARETAWVYEPDDSVK